MLDNPMMNHSAIKNFGYDIYAAETYENRSNSFNFPIYGMISASHRYGKKFSISETYRLFQGLKFKFNAEIERKRRL